MNNFFHQEALDHKRRKLFGEVTLIQPLGFFITTAVFFCLTLLAAWFLSSREYIRKEIVIGYIAPSSGVTVIRADRGGWLVAMKALHHRLPTLCRFGVQYNGQFMIAKQV